MTEQLHESPADSGSAQQPETAQASAAISVGQALRRAREARGLTVVDVAQTLKLGARQVEALERDDWTALPGATFVRGFVRNYSRLLGVEPGPLMQQLDHILEKPKDTLTVPDTPPRAVVLTSRSRDRVVVAVGAILLLLAALAYFLLPGDLQAWRAQMQNWLDGAAQPPVAQRAQVPAPEPLFPPGSNAAQLMTPPPAAEPVAPDANPTSPVVPVVPATNPLSPAGAEAPALSPPASAEPQPAKLPIAAEATLRLQVGKESWVEVRDGEKNVVFSRRMAAGASESLTAKAPLSVVIGYAAGVTVSWRGKVVDLTPHSKNNVARLVLE